MKMLVKSKLEARADGYIDGLLARPSNRLLYPPFDRFAYLAGLRATGRVTHDSLIVADPSTGR